MKVVLNATVIGIYPQKEVTVRIEGVVEHYKGDAIIAASGASENMVTFDGWTLPGVIGAGAAQTMMNIHGVKPGRKILMLGSGNVGLVVSFQLMQCGCEVAALVDAAPRVGDTVSMPPKLHGRECHSIYHIPLSKLRGKIM